jgi:starch synthase
MGDVVGSLPAYLPEEGIHASVIIPKYSNDWLGKNKFSIVHKGRFNLGEEIISFSIESLTSSDLGFPLYTVNIPGKFDRSSIYLNVDGKAFPDEIERNLSFQIAIIEWLLTLKKSFDLLHCHDHMTGLIPFMIKYCKDYKELKKTPTFFTIHNGQYRGIFDWSKVSLFPSFHPKDRGILDWDGNIHSLATAIKCSWKLNTVSPSYMEELQNDFDTLTSLVQQEKYKSVGILNGIDAALWDPMTDSMISHKLKQSPFVFKRNNKKVLAEKFGFKASLPLFSFIGRFAYEKSADLLASSFEKILSSNKRMQIIVLGSGDREIEAEILEAQKRFPKNFTAIIAYNEALAHQIYAASDYIIMPSRFEPCGLNQMFAMRYGTVPIVRKTGGLKDTVPDIGDGGNGISFLRASQKDIVFSMNRALALYKDKEAFKNLVQKLMKLDFSWKKSAQEYALQYLETINQDYD